MPTVSIHKNEFNQHLGACFELQELIELLLAFGLEYESTDTNEDGTEFYRIEVPANRPDLLSVEGISDALSIFIERKESPCFLLTKSLSYGTITLTVDATTNSVRPYAFAAILQGITFTPKLYKSFIDLQEKLCFNIGRRRTAVAIGTHDLDTISENIFYKAQIPSEISFCPLNMTSVMDGKQIVETLNTHSQLKSYAQLFENWHLYPIIYDQYGTVLSLPPLINGDVTKIIPLKTKNVFIEVTSTDYTRGEIVLNSLCAAFSRYCSPSFEIYPVLVKYDSGHIIHKQSNFPSVTFFPRLTPYCLNASVDYIRKLLGLTELDQKTVCSALKKMMIHATPDPADKDIVKAECPITRSDVFHQCDLAEDVAIAIGINTFPARFVPSVSELTSTKLAGYIRQELANCGVHEILTWGLCSLKEGFEYLRSAIPKSFDYSDPHTGYNAFSCPVELSNPKTQEFEIVRTSLIPGLLKAFKAHQAATLPLKLFEIGQTFFIDKSMATQTATDLRCAVIFCGTNSGLEVVHGLLDTVLSALNCSPEYSDKIENKEFVYKLIPDDDLRCFLPKRCVRVSMNNKNIGMMGVVHPEVLKELKLTCPCSLFEISLNPFLTTPTYKLV